MHRVVLGVDRHVAIPWFKKLIREGKRDNEREEKREGDGGREREGVGERGRGGRKEAERREREGGF